VEDIVRAHWKSYGRNYYSRYDYEGVDKSAAEGMMRELEASFGDLAGRAYGSFTVARADQFEYHDPVDGSVSKNQGVRILFTDGSRVVFRLSGTAGSGATIRMYLEKYEPNDGNVFQQPSEALRELVAIALQISKLAEHTGRNEPTVIT
jgi:phosphoglucomutase